MRIEEFLAVSKRKLAKHLPGWTANLTTLFNLHIGCCVFAHKLLLFDRRFILACQPEDAWKTLYHEIAHGLIGNDKHDEQWKQVHLSLGGDGDYKLASNTLCYEWMTRCLACGSQDELSHYDMMQKKKHIYCDCDTEKKLPLIWRYVTEEELLQRSLKVSQEQLVESVLG